LSIGTVLNVALLLVFGSFLVRGWSQFKLLDKFLLSLCVASGVLNAARQFLSQEVIEIFPDKITMYRPFIFGGDKIFSADKISDFGVDWDNESSDNPGDKYLCFKHRFHKVKFARGISDDDATRVLEAVGEIGGVGAMSASDPFGSEKKIVTLDLNLRAPK